MATARQAYGRFGEDVAARWYARQGYVVAARNWRCRAGEIDLVLTRGSLVVFCEVKARSGRAYGSGFDAVTPAKQARLRRLAAHWLAGSAQAWPHVRFDVAAIDGVRVEVIEGAF